MTKKDQLKGTNTAASEARILGVSSDPKLRKWLSMALSLELGCPILMVDGASSAEEAATRLTPALVMIDEQFLKYNAADLCTRLHNIAGLEQLPTLFLNVSNLPQNDHQG